MLLNLRRVRYVDYVVFMFKKTDGSVGEVTVDCKVISGTALRNVDYLGDDVTLKFDHGETKKSRLNKFYAQNLY